MWEEIPKTGLLTQFEYREDPDGKNPLGIRYDENASCEFAQYWYKHAIDELFRSAPCHECWNDTCDQNTCAKYKEWVDSLTPVQRQMCTDHWMEKTKGN
jgi:hypothetical protein